MKTVLALAVGIALLCATGSALAAGSGGQLELMPLPRSAIGAGTGGLVLARQTSGVVSNADAARSAGAGFTAADLANRGRITGYSLDYVRRTVVLPDPRHRLIGVRTIAETYSSRATATRGLAFWRGVTHRLAGAQPNGLTIAVSTFRDGGTTGFDLTYRRARQPLYYVGDVIFRSGRLLGAVFVSATDNEGLRVRTLQLAHSLANRIRRVSGKARPSTPHSPIQL